MLVWKGQEHGHVNKKNCKIRTLIRSECELEAITEIGEREKHQRISVGVMVDKKEETVKIARIEKDVASPSY